jgi:hypothetical protein
MDDPREPRRDVGDDAPAAPSAPGRVDPTRWPDERPPELVGDRPGDDTQTWLLLAFQAVSFALALVVWRVGRTDR